MLFRSAFPTTVEHVDFLAADAHKWLLGPCGAGVLYVRKDLQERLRPIVHGWHNILSPDLLTQEEMRFRDDARRYEPGSQTYVAVAGLRACFELIAECGVPNIAADLAAKRARLIDPLRARGYNVLHAEVPPESAGGITTFHREGADMAALQIGRAHV